MDKTIKHPIVKIIISCILFCMLVLSVNSMTFADEGEEYVIVATIDVPAEMNGYTLYGYVQGYDNIQSYLGDLSKIEWIPQNLKAQTKMIYYEGYGNTTPHEISPLLFEMGIDDSGWVESSSYPNMWAYYIPDSEDPIEYYFCFYYSEEADEAIPLFAYSTKGKFAKGWKEIDGNMYYFQNTGIMATGWQLINNEFYYFDNNGLYVTGIQKLNGKYYQFDNNGICLGEVILGDVNSDEQVDSDDAMLILQYYAGLISSGQLNIHVADVNADQQIDSDDAMIILQYYAGIIPHI